ncbi:hypothetical protein HOC80_04750 [archaeon]|jgi:hypothetical protein|nr:hypothetical protein [archaeon]MBT4417383.1 hypothetical protein [archaeon]
MTQNREFALEACLEFWNDYSGAILGLGYLLSKDSLMMETKGISIVATIRPAYSRDMLEEFRKVLPKEYEFKGEVFPVKIFPPVASLALDDLFEL